MLNDALAVFSEFIESDINQNIVKLIFFTRDNAVPKYGEMCKDFPQFLSEPYKDEGYFDGTAASAFVNGNKYGVLIDADIPFPRKDVVMAFLHEISHLFCTRNEVPGGNFYDKYCTGTGTEDGMINAGHMIWREAIADIMADAAMSDFAFMTLADVHDKVMKQYTALSFIYPDSKRAMSMIIAYKMLSREVAGTEDWNEAEAAIMAQYSFDDPRMIKILKLVFEKLHTPPFWEITPEFITDLGDLYLMVIYGKAFKRFAGKL